MFGFFRSIIDAKQLQNRVEELERDLNLMKTQQSADFADLSDLIQNKLNALSQREIMRQKRGKNGNPEQTGEQPETSNFANLQPGQVLNVNSIKG